MRSAYQAALDQFMARNYQAAIEQFQALLQSDINKELADNCHYWIGESYYALRDYNQAIQHFQEVFNFPGSGKRPYAQLMIGNAYAALGNTDAAREAYNTVVNTYQTSSLVSKAQEKLARLK
jgi:tol-pal system protein YbgF